ncbi:MAG: helix-hairpin-helix domain-containing protein [Caldilineaceae bacterium]
MHSFLPLFSLLPLAGLIRIAQQEEARSGLSWAWILLMLLLAALFLLWWLLGPGAKERRRKMADLPKPVAPEPPVTFGRIDKAASASPSAAAPTPAAGSISSAPAVSLETPAAAATVEGAPEGDSGVADRALAETDAEKSLPAGPQAAASQREAKTEPDNLRKLDGIGPKVAGVLAANGIDTFAQLADTSVARLGEILEGEGLKFMKPDTWPAQAAFAAAGDWDGLQNLQSELKGGHPGEK